MPADIIQTNDPTQFIPIAKLLGYDTLCIISPSQNTPVQKISTQKTDCELEGIHIKWIFGIEPSAFLKGKHTQHVAIKSSSYDRAVLERHPFLLYDLETNTWRDQHHFRSSGLNHITCKIAAEKTRIGISLDEIKTALRTPELLGRIMQNIRLCRKYRVQMSAGSFAKKPMDMRSSHDVAALLRVLGMTAKEAKGAQCF